jgi:hypothetical protein
MKKMNLDRILNFNHKILGKRTKIQWENQKVIDSKKSEKKIP